MDSTEWLPGDDIALMVAALEERFHPRNVRPVVTTTSSRVLPYTQNTTPSFKLVSSPARVQPSTSQINRASSAPTSSSTQGSEGSSSLNVYLIGKTLAPLLRWNGKEVILPGRAEGSEFEKRVRYSEVSRGYHDGQELIEFAGRLCYESFDLPNPDTATNSGYIRNIVSLGHESVLEHVSVTFYVEGVSRNLSHELIRHRHLSFSELSQRYVDMEDANQVVPPAYREVSDFDTVIPLRDEYKDKYRRNVEVLQEDHGFSRKQAREAARSGLPGSTETKFVVSGNLRAWRDVLKKRLSVHADAEMQLFAAEVHDILSFEYPDVFADINYEVE